MAKKVHLPDSVRERVEEFVNVTKTIGFFDDPLDIPEGYKENGEIHLWNNAAEHYLSNFISGNEDKLLTEDQALEILNKTIINTNLDSLMDQGLIDGIENEDGEMVYWATDEGKKVAKNDDK